MASPLSKAVADGDLNAVLAILQNAQSADIELADQGGNTPLIEAIQKGHVEIVRALLDSGADPNHTASRNTPLISLTTDPAIQELLNNAIQSRSYGTHVQGHPAAQEQVYSHEGGSEPPKAYYPLPGAYYYPGPPPPFPDGAMPYYHPSLSGDPSIGHLPPPEIARMIPCRYFPACRYGASCMFAHPTSATGYAHVPVPAPYPHHYDPMSAPPYAQNYYPGSPPFQPPMHPVNMTSPHNPPQAPPMHARTSSDSVASPGANFPGPGPVNYGPVPSGPYSSHPGQAPVMGPVPPQHQGPPPPPGQQGPPQSYPANAQQGPVPSFPVPTDTGYPPQIPSDGSLPQNPPPSHPGEEGFVGGHIPPSGPGYRRPGLRKNSYASKRPACLFFPSGRCRNGNDCRFPHILPENGGFGPGRMGSKPRYPLNGVTNNVSNLEEKFSRMNVQEEENRTHPSTGHSSRSHSSERRKHLGQQNGFHPNNKKQHAARAQRVPTFDEFPTLNGTSTTNSSPKASGPNGLTAAQVLQAPPPFRPKEGSRIPSPDQSANGDASKATTEANEKVSNVTPPVEKIPLSFAAVTTNGVNGAAKEVSVGA